MTGSKQKSEIVKQKKNLKKKVEFSALSDAAGPEKQGIYLPRPNCEYRNYSNRTVDPI